VHQHVDGAEARHRGLHGDAHLEGVDFVQRQREQALVGHGAHASQHGQRVGVGGDDVVAGGERLADEVGAEARRGAGHEPGLTIHHLLLAGGWSCRRRREMAHADRGGCSKVVSA